MKWEIKSMYTINTLPKTNQNPSSKEHTQLYKYTQITWSWYAIPTAFSDSAMVTQSTLEQSYLISLLLRAGSGSPFARATGVDVQDTKLSDPPSVQPSLSPMEYPTLPASALAKKKVLVENFYLAFVVPELNNKPTGGDYQKLLRATERNISTTVQLDWDK